MKLEIKDLHASIEGKPILKGMTLTVQAGEIHAVMGPNGAGKSTLAKVLGGHPFYQIDQGTITLNGADLLEMEPSERAAAGLFMSFQYPLEIPGVSNTEFLRYAVEAQRKSRGEEELTSDAFTQLLCQQVEAMRIPKDFLERSVNEGFSGGEKKRNEILQMAMLDPKLAILDETDSGLDIDALRIVAEGINRLMTPERGLILITHYQRLLDYVKPDFVHVMVEGRIVETGGPDLALKLEAQGYDWLVAV